MLNFMNNSQNIPNDPAPLDEEIATDPKTTTVFSDGSTFDYENGYQNNGAPVATRDRTENPKIVKSHKIVTFPRVVEFFVGLLVLATLAVAILCGISSIQAAANWNALKAGVNGSGQVEIVQIVKGDLLVKRPDGGLFKCAVSFISNNGTPVGLVFCSPGGPSTFSIPIPHDPNSIFYVGPTDK